MTIKCCNVKTASSVFLFCVKKKMRKEKIFWVIHKTHTPGDGRRVSGRMPENRLLRIARSFREGHRSFACRAGGGSIFTTKDEPR